LTNNSSNAKMAIENSFHLPISMRITPNRITSLLRQRGYKITPQRRAVLNTIALSHDHLTPAAIYEKVHQENPGVGLVTVYRTLDLLTELGLICEVHAGGSCRSYLMRRPSEHHHHLICSECGTVADFAECDLNKLQQKLSRKTGFEINSHLLEFSGLCENCRERKHKNAE
jgi:Fur family ferric uptake transcriptional regulator